MPKAATTYLHKLVDESVLAPLPSTYPGRTGPAEYDATGVKYLTPDDQDALPYRIAKLLPWNHFGRKNIGYMYAIQHGAKVSSRS